MEGEGTLPDCWLLVCALACVYVDQNYGSCNPLQKSVWRRFRSLEKTSDKKVLLLLLLLCVMPVHSGRLSGTNTTFCVMRCGSAADCIVCFAGGLGLGLYGAQIRLYC